MNLHKKNYFEYERQAARVVLGPLVKSLGPFRRVVDLGCGYGGCLRYLVEEGLAEWAVGVDSDAEMISSGRESLGTFPKVKLVHQDLLDFSEQESFDFALLRDIVEHVPDPGRVLAQASRLLTPGGICFVSFAGFYSPFGGHQHCMKDWISKLPYAQFLPASFVLRTKRFGDTAYKTAKELEQDVRQVFRARLSIPLWQDFTSTGTYYLLRKRKAAE